MAGWGVGSAAVEVGAADRGGIREAGEQEGDGGAGGAVEPAGMPGLDELRALGQGLPPGTVAAHGVVEREQPAAGGDRADPVVRGPAKVDPPDVAEGVRVPAP